MGDRGIPPRQDRGFEQGPQSSIRLLTFLRTQGERFLGREIATGDELLPVKARLIEYNPFLKTDDSLATQLTIDAIHISALVLGVTRLQYIAQNDVPANLLPDIITAVSEGSDISEQTLVQLNQVVSAFEARKQVIRERHIAFTDSEQNAIMAQAANILPVATRALLGRERIFATPLILAAFTAIDEGFNDNGSQSGAIIPPTRPDSGLTGVTADLPRTPSNDSAGAKAQPEAREEELVVPGRRSI